MKSFEVENMGKRLSRRTYMAIEEIKKKVEKYWEAFNNGDLDGQLALMSENATFTTIGSTPMSDCKIGKNEIRKHFKKFNELIEPGAVMNIRRLIAENDIVACLSEGNMFGRIGKIYNNQYVFIFQFANDEIIKITEYLDTELIETSLFGKSLN